MTAPPPPAAVPEPSGWRIVLRLAWPYRRQLLFVALFALLATGTDLLAPLIYREAVNDIAGLFVGSSTASTTEGDAILDMSDEEEGGTSSPGRNTMPDDLGLAVVPPPAAVSDSAPAPRHARPARRRPQAKPPVRHPAARPPPPPKPEPHTRHHVAPRTVSQTFPTLMWAVVGLFGINMLSHLCALIADQRTVRLASAIESDFIRDTFGHVLELPLSFFSRRASGTLAKQIDQSDQIAPIVTALAKDIAPALISMVGVLVIMFMQSWRLSIAALVTLPPYALVVLRSSRRLETGLTRYYEMWDAVSSRIQDALGAIKTVKLSGAERRETGQLYTQSGAAYETYSERNRLANQYIFLQSSLSYLSQALVLGFGGWLVLERGLTPGDVVMFVVYLDRLYAPIESLTSISVTMQEHLTSLERANRLLLAQPELLNGQALRAGPGRVEFRNVRFGYSPERPVLQGVSMVLEPGHTTALVGPSGAGKTTTADLMLRLYDVESGEILLDGQDVQLLDPSAVRSQIGVVAADGAIFRGTLADNLRYKRPEATDDEVYAAAVTAGLSATLARLPQGLETEVGEGGVGLSVGERQRLQIARALVGRPRVLILDEATANLDYATEQGIRHAVLDRPDRPTTLVITHRYAMAETCDRVVVLQAGQVIAQGTPAELVKSCEWFARFAAGSAQKDIETSATAADKSTQEDEEDA